MSTQIYTQSLRTHINICLQILPSKTLYHFNTLQSEPYIEKNLFTEGRLQEKSSRTEGHPRGPRLQEDYQIKKAAGISRGTALWPSPQRPPLVRAPLVTTCLTGLAGVIKKHLSMLHISQRPKQAFPKPPLVTFKRPNNL